MNNESLTNRQGISIVTNFIMGSSVLIGNARGAKQDAWISILFGIIMAIPAILIYARLTQLYPGKSLYDILEYILGKILGKIASLLFIWYFFHLGALVIRNITEFIQVVSFPETPQFFVALFIGLLLIYTLKKDIGVLVRVIEFILPLLIIMFISTMLLAIPKMNLENMEPLLYNGWKPVLKGGFDLFSFPFAETVIFLTLFHTIEENKSSPYKIYFLGLFLGGLILTLATIRNILILGPSNISNLYFPSNTAIGIINIGNFLSRIEVVVSITFLVSCYTKMSICLFATSMGISKLFNLKDYKQIVSPITLLMICLSFVLYNSVMEMYEFNKYYTYYAIPFQILFPILILIVGRIRKKPIQSSQITNNNEN